MGLTGGGALPLPEVAALRKRLQGSWRPWELAFTSSVHAAEVADASSGRTCSSIDALIYPKFYLVSRGT